MHLPSSACIFMSADSRIKFCSVFDSIQRLCQQLLENGAGNVRILIL